MSLAAPGTNPASNLELKLPHTIGSANQLLKVDGSGQLGWADDNSGLSISNNADNRIVTGTGSALNAEAYLTYDSQVLTVNGTSNDTPLILDTTNSNGAHMRFRTNGGTQHFLGCGGGISLGDSQDLSMRAYDNLLFATGNSSSERVRIDSSGRLLVGVTTPSTSSSERFEVSGMSLFMNNSSSTGTVYIRNQASDAGTGHVLVFQDGSANRGGITLDNNDQVTHTGHQGVLFKTGGTLGGGYERARFPNGGGLQLKNTGANKGIIWNRTGSENATTFANVQGSGGRGIIETQINNIPSSTTTDLAKSHWGGLCLIGWANSSGTSSNYQGHEQVMFGYNGTPSSRYKRQFAGNLTITYTMSAYTLRVNHNGSVNIDFWCILIGV